MVPSPRLVRRPFLAALTVLVLVASACSSDGSTTAQRSPSSTATTSERSPVGGSPTPATDGSTNAERTDGYGRTADPTEGRGDTDDAMSFSEFWPQRERFVGREVVLHAKVVFELDCPPPGGGGSCVATAYLAGPETDVFVAHERKEALLVLEDGEPVRCETPTTLDHACQGWEQHEEYVVRGSVGRSDAQADGTDGFSIDVEQKRRST